MFEDLLDTVKITSLIILFLVFFVLIAVPLFIGMLWYFYFIANLFGL